MAQGRLQTICYTLIILLISGYILYIGAPIFIPIIFAILLGVFLNPVYNKLIPFVKIKWLTIVLTFTCFFVPLVLLATLFSIQLMNIFESLPSIDQSLNDGINKIVNTVNRLAPSVNLSAHNLIEGGEQSDLRGPLKMIAQGLTSTSSIIASSGLVIIFAFLLMYYKKSFKRFIIDSFDRHNRPEIKGAMQDIKNTIQSYIGGLGLVVVLLSVFNTIGLTLIGIEYAIFWGTLAGILAMIPYIGTLLGGMLPFVFALSTAEASWQPIAVVAYYLFIQQLEGNFITPKIVGDKVDINPLFAILALLFFGSFWGIAGVILALPLISIVKIILEHFDETKALSILMSSDITELAEPGREPN